MAARLSADLGLHLDITQHIQSVALTERDLEIRRITFWGVFIQEQSVEPLELREPSPCPLN
jgi:hypothetical protein